METVGTKACEGGRGKPLGLKRVQREKENCVTESVCPLRRETVGVQACVKLKRKPLEAKHVSEEKGNRWK